MRKRLLLGMLTPSSNGVLEPVTTAMIAGLPDAIVILCTNVRGAPLVAALEAELGIPVHDSIATVVWKSLQLVGADTRRIKGWGSLFDTLAGVPDR